MFDNSRLRESRLTKRIASDQLSYFRTTNTFLNYAECESEAQFREISAFAAQNRFPLIILGNGSNVLFCRKTINSIVVKNMLPMTWHVHGDFEISTSSTVPVARIIKWCLQRNLDSFYYLASVPATVGGAVAMNAGRGISYNKTILDFVTSVSYIEDGVSYKVTPEQINLGYRKTIFTGSHRRLITQVRFRFEPAKIAGNPARDRVAWSKEFQDYTAPNCGSVFKHHNPRIMAALRGFHLRNASFSRKTANWLLYKGGSGRSLCWLIAFARFLHLITFRRCELELIKVK